LHTGHQTNMHPRGLYAFRISGGKDKLVNYWTTPTFLRGFLNRSSESHIAIYTALMHILVMSALTYTKNYTPEVKEYKL